VQLLEKRLEYVKAYHTQAYFKMNLCYSKKWVKTLGPLKCDEISKNMIQEYLIKRKKETSAFSANKDLKCLRATFNWAIQNDHITNDPTRHIAFFPVEINVKYIPPVEDVYKILLMADSETQDYLYAIKETMARSNEINNLKWEDVNFENQTITLFTRKKKGGHKTPGIIPMTSTLYNILSRRYNKRDKRNSWIFVNPLTKSHFNCRRKSLKTLCKKAGVKYFTLHALRHLGASMLDNAGVRIGTIQKLLRHENRKTTEHYIQSIGESEREAIRILEESHTKSHTKQKRDCR
jgi:integrase